MSADTLTISLTGPLADEVRGGSGGAGLTPEEYVRQQLAWDIVLGDDDDEQALDVKEDRAAYEDFERTGMGIPGEEVEAWLQSPTTDNPFPRPRPHKLKQRPCGARSLEAQHARCAGRPDQAGARRRV